VDTDVVDGDDDRDANFITATSAALFDAAFAAGFVKTIAVEVARAVHHEIPTELKILILEFPQRRRRSGQVLFDKLIFDGNVAGEGRSAGGDEIFGNDQI